MTESNLKEMFRMMDTCMSAIEELRTEVKLGFEKINSELAEIKTDVSQLKTDVAQLNVKFEELNKGQIRLETGLGKNNRLVDRLAGEMMRVDIRVGRLEDATV